MGVSQPFLRGRTYAVKVRAQGQPPKNVSLRVKAPNMQRAMLEREKLAILVAAGKWRTKQRVTLQAFLSEYHTHYVAAAGPERREARERTWQATSYGLRCAVGFLERAGLRYVPQVLQRHAEQFRDYRMSGDPAPSLVTVRGNIRNCQAAWNWAIRHEYADSNPFAGVPFPKIVKSDPRNLSVFEVRKVFEDAREHRYDMFARMACALYSGCRMGEILSLQQTDLVWGDAGYIRLGPGKDGEPRTTLFPAELQSILAPYRAEAGLVFSDSISAVTVEKFVIRLSRRTGVKFSLHDLRRSFAGFLAMAGVPPHVTQGYLGHSDLQTTMGYYVQRNHELRPGDGEAMVFGLAKTAEALKGRVGT